jgi:nucleoside-diphosphate-sugar epimerase
MNKTFELVTGAAGFIGSKIVEELLLQGRKVIALDCFLPDLYPKEEREFRWNFLGREYRNSIIKIEFDLRKDDFSILNKFNIGSVFNFAAMPGLIGNWSNFEPYYSNNIYALHRLLEYLKGLQIVSFIQASTSSVYGRFALGTETSELCPVSPYGVSKLAAEKLALAYMQEFAIPTKILRYFSVYGPNQRPDMAYARIIDSIINKSPFTVFGDGSQARSNTFIDDIVSATVLADSKVDAGTVLNICGDEEVSLNDAISIIETELQSPLIRIERELRAGDQQKTFGDNSAAKLSLGWVAEVKIREGLSRQIEAALKLSKQQRN